MITPKQNQLSQWAQYIAAGVAWYLADTSAKKPLKDSLPGFPTSDVSDAFLIAAWGMYHGYGQIVAIRKSRGCSWKVDFKSCLSFLVTVVAPTDHRDGITITEQL